jgi:ABC-type lipoprotein export system ATPase subunit
MSRIEDIHIHNFKFFNEAEPIKLHGKHLLLYGENGSGKSSIYWSLYTLFEAALKKDKIDIEKYFKHHTEHEQSLINIHTEPIVSTENLFYDSFVKVTTIHTPPEDYEVSLYNTAIKNSSVAKEINQASDFISYKVLYKFQDFWNGSNMDLADIFIGYILPYLNFPKKDLIRSGASVEYSNASEMYDEIQKGPGTVLKDNGKTRQVYKYSYENKKFNTFVNHFNHHIKDVIDFVNINAPKILKKLGYDIVFELRYTKLTTRKADVHYNYSKFKIEFVITEYLGEPITITRPQSFLNEAKITAIALSIRLAILRKRINREAGNILKFIVFDDVMISLDMNNRDKLMDYLLNPENKFTDDYQLLFLTHDKSFYDFVAHKIKKWDRLSNWEFKEMYTGIDNDTKREFPIIINSDLEFIDKAKKYYDARDFTAAAIYIRKELEKTVNERLPDELVYKSDGSFLSLQTLWGNLCQRYSALKKPLSAEIQDLFNQTKLMVLNPQAHFQRLSQPLYKIELDNAFKLINDLITNYPIPNQTILLVKGTVLEFKHPIVNYTFTLELISDFYIDGFEGETEVVYPKGKVLNFKYNDTDFYIAASSKQLNEAEITECKAQKTKLNRVLVNLKLDTILNITDDMFMDNTSIKESIWNLKEVLDKAEIGIE